MKILKPVVLAILLGIGFVGCETLKQVPNTMSVCHGDAICEKDARDKAMMLGAIVALAFPVAGGGVAAGAYSFFLWLGGRAKKKKQNPDT